MFFYANGFIRVIENETGVTLIRIALFP